MGEQSTGAVKAAVVFHSSVPQDHHVGSLHLPGRGLGERKGDSLRMVAKEVGGAVHTAQVAQQSAGVDADGEGCEIVVIRQRSPSQRASPQLRQKRQGVNVVREREHDMRARGGPGNGT